MLFLNNTFESAEICLNNCILYFKYLSIIYKLSFFEKIGCFCHDIRVKFHLLDESNSPNNLPYQADVCLDARHQTFVFGHMVFLLSCPRPDAEKRRRQRSGEKEKRLHRDDALRSRFLHFLPKRCPDLDREISNWFHTGGSAFFSPRCHRRRVRCSSGTRAPHHRSVCRKFHPHT